MRIIAVFLLPAILTGCGVVGGVNYIGRNIDQMSARDAYVKSAAEYRECIRTRSPGQCESQKAVMDLDEKTLSQISAANVNVNNR